MARKTTKKTRIFIVAERLKSLGKKGKTRNFPRDSLERRKKSKEIQKSKEKKIRASNTIKLPSGAPSPELPLANYSARETQIHWQISTSQPRRRWLKSRLNSGWRKSWEAKKPINIKHKKKHFSDGFCGTIVPGTNPHPSQGQTGQNGDFTVESNRERAWKAGLSQVPFCPGERPHLSQGRFLFVPDTVPPKMFMFIGCFLARKRGVGFKGGSLHDGFGGFDGSGEHLALQNAHPTKYSAKRRPWRFWRFWRLWRFRSWRLPPLNSTPLFRHPDKLTLSRR